MHPLEKYFDHIYVIIHPESLRWVTFFERWKLKNYTVAKFVEQDVECKSLNGQAKHIFEQFPDYIPLKDPLSTGQVACALAHMLIYKDIIDKKRFNCLILEDDSVFNEISNLEIGLQSDYDILSLFTAQCDLFAGNHNPAPYTAQYSRAGTSAYVLRTYEVAEKLLNSQMTLMNTADGVIMESDMKIYAVWPPVCSCDESPSIIVNGLY